MRATSISTMIASDYVRRCSSLSVPESRAVDKQKLQAVVTQEALTSGYFLDPKARELEVYVTCLHSHSAWQLLESHDAVRIEALPQSRYGTELVFRTEAHLHPRVKANFAVMMMDNPDFRTQWDCTAKEMTVVYVADENAYIRHYIFHPEAPLEEREFLEKCQIRVAEGELRMVWYSIDDPSFPPKLLVPRAHTHFGMLQLFSSRGEVTLLITQQVSSGQTHCELEDEVTQMLDWVMRLRDAIEAKSY